MVQFHALGSLRVTDADSAPVSIGGPRQRRLLAMLLIHRNSVVSVDRLVEAVFAGEPSAAASTTLRSYIARIRRAIGDDSSESRVVTQAPGYMLRLPNDAFDVARFEALVSEGRARLTRDEAIEAAAVLHDGLALWSGDAYAEFDDEDWAQPEATRLSEIRLVAHESLFDAELACGRAAEVIPMIEPVACAHPLREGLHSQLMVALYRAGRQADALRVYRDYRERLLEDLGLDPTPALTELERRILAHDPTLLLTEHSGRRLRGYRLGERLGTGRVGTVYAAHLPGVDRDQVIKVFRQDVADHPAFVRAFEPTAHRVASLRHPAIVPISDYWREPGAAYVVVRRMRGGSLADRLAGGAMSRTEVAALVSRIGGALLTAASAGIVHGNVTAHNVLYDDSGEPVLTDFSLASPDEPSSWGDDVHDLAAMMCDCIDSGDGEVAAVLTDALATGNRPSMAELVRRLTAALAAGYVGEDGRRPNPYRGLRAFEETDAAEFFGRRPLVDEILGRLGRDDVSGRLVLVVAGSGTGKSSLVRAGVVPKVRRGGAALGSENWFVTTMLPGVSPFKELAESLRQVAITGSGSTADDLATDGGIDRAVRRLAPNGGQVLLVVDQFEELFTLASPGDQRAFLEGLAHAVTAPDSRLRVVATLRADFYDRPLAFSGFGSLVNESTVTMAGMSPGDLEAAIVEPAERVGRPVERALVADLVSAMADEPAALPALQFTLHELAEACDDTLTLVAYQAMGGVRGAIAARAEALYRSLGDEEQVAVRQLFERLVVIGPNAEPTRRRVPRIELGGIPTDPTVDDAIDRWTNARLLSIDRDPQTRSPMVELAHEALLREWPRLRVWIDEDRDALIVLEQLRESAVNWHGPDRDPDALYRGTRLQVALDVADGRPGGIPPLEREYLDASAKARDAAAQHEAERVARQALANRRLRVQLVAVAAALVIALVVGFIAVDQRGKARQERRVATARELAAASSANLADDPERSMLLALAAIETTRTSDGVALPEAIDALHTALTSSRIVTVVPDVGGAVDWSPVGDAFVTEGPEESGLVDIRDVLTGETRRSWHGHDIDVNDVVFDLDGSTLATTGDDGALRVWDHTTGDELKAFEFPDGGPVWGPSFSADGTRVAASWLAENAVRVFDTDTGAMISEIESEWAVTTSLSPDGETVAFGNYNRPEAVVADVDSGDALFTLGSDEGPIRGVAYSPDGRWIATTGSDGTAHIWDAHSGGHLHTIAAHTGPVNSVDWSADGSKLATVSNDGTARLTLVSDGGVRETVTVSGRSTSNGLVGVAFSPDGGRILTGDWAVTAATIWDVSDTAGAELLNVDVGVPGGAIPDARFVGVGDAVVAGTIGGQATIWDIDTGAPTHRIGPRGPDEALTQLAMSPDGKLIATSTSSATDDFPVLPVDVWDVATKERLFSVTSEFDALNVQDVEWSPDGDLLAVAVNEGWSGGVIVVDRSGEDVATIREDDGVIVTSIAFSSDGRLLAWPRKTERDDPARRGVRLWDVTQGESIGTIETPAALVAFDPAGHFIVSIRQVEGVADIWDATTLEPVATLVAPATFNAVAFSPDGSRIAMGGGDGVIRIFDPRTGIQQTALNGHVTAAGSVSFSPDGTRLVSMEDGGIVRVWALNLNDLVATANRRLTRRFDDEECRQFLHVDECPRAGAASAD